MRVETRHHIVHVRHGFPFHYRHLTRIGDYLGFALWGVAGFVVRKQARSWSRHWQNESHRLEA